MNIFEKWHPVVRWLLFVPTFFVVYFGISIIVYSLFISRYFGSPEESVIAYIVHAIQKDGISLVLGVYISCMCAPKKRVVIASVYAGIVLFLLGIGLMEVTYTASVKEIWLFIFTCAVSILGCVISIVSVINEEKQRKQQTISF